MLSQQQEQDIVINRYRDGIDYTVHSSRQSAEWKFQNLVKDILMARDEKISSKDLYEYTKENSFERGFDSVEISLCDVSNPWVPGCSAVDAPPEENKDTLVMLKNGNLHIARYTGNGNVMVKGSGMTTVYSVQDVAWRLPIPDVPYMPKEV